MRFLHPDGEDDGQNGNGQDEPIVEAGQYDLGDDIGERIGKDNSSDDSAL